METTTMDNTQRIRTMIRTIDTYLSELHNYTDTDKIDTLIECIGCLSVAIESQQEIIKEIITDKDTDHEKE